MPAPIFTTAVSSPGISGPIELSISTTTDYFQGDTSDFTSDPVTSTVTNFVAPLTYVWNSFPGSSPNSSSAATTTYQLTDLEEGDNLRTVQLTVTDARGEQATASILKSVFVFNPSGGGIL